MFNLVKREQKRDQNQNNNVSPVRSLQRQIDNLFNDFFGDSLINFNTDLGNSFQPRANISEDKKAYYIEIELAGIKKEDIKLNYDANNLSITAKKEGEHREDNKNYHLVECFSGSFYRSFQLPEDIDHNNISSEMKDGILKVILPKTAQNNSKTNEIKIV